MGYLRSEGWIDSNNRIVAGPIEGLVFGESKTDGAEDNPTSDHQDNFQNLETSDITEKITDSRFSHMANEIALMLQGVGLGHSLDTANHCVEYGITWEITSLESLGIFGEPRKSR